MKSTRTNNENAQGLCLLILGFNMVRQISDEIFRLWADATRISRYPGKAERGVIRSPIFWLLVVAFVGALVFLAVNISDL